MSTDIETLRDEIASVDSEILSLVGRRADIAKEIGSIKKELGLPVTDENVEKKVMARYVSEGEKHGIDADLMEKLAKTLIKIAKSKEV